MVQTRSTKMIEDPLAPSNERPAAVNSPARSSDSTQDDPSLSIDSEGETLEHHGNPLEDNSSEAPQGLRLGNLSDSGLSSLPMPEDDSNHLTPEGESDDEGMALQSRGSPLANNSSAPTRKRRLRTPSESGLSSDGMYKNGDEEESNTGSFSKDDDETISEDSHREGRRQAKAGKAPPKRHPNAPRISKLQKKIQDAKAMGIDLDENGVRKGRVRHTTNGLEYLSEGNWIPACYHTDIRKKLLELTDDMGSYVKEPHRGWDGLDRTAFEESQKDWVFSDRRRRPDFLFLWEDPGYYLDYDPEFWYDLGRIVLDTKNHPLKLWRELPLTISGQCEGYRMETWRRLNTRITMNDLRARMPHQTCKGKGKVSKIIKTPMLANRMSRDRMMYGLKAWDPKQGSDIKQYRMMQTMPDVIQRMLIRTNSTRGYRDLTEAEVDYVDLGNKGTAASLAKAGPRQLDDMTRLENQEKKHKRRSKKIGASSVKIHEVITEAFPEELDEPQKKKQKTRAWSTVSPAAPALVYPPMAFGEEEDQVGHGEEMIGEQSGRGSEELPEMPEEEETWYERPDLLPAGRSTENDYTQYDRPGAFSSNARDNYNMTMQRVTEGNIGNNHLYNKNNPQAPSDAQLQRLGFQRVHGGNLGIDFRYRKPESVSDVTFIENALQVSRDDFQRILPFAPATVTDRLQPYAYQLSELQAEFSRTYPGPNPPLMRSWGHMSSFENYMGRQEGSGAGYRGTRGHGLGDFDGNTLL
ncbi:MAG: hypothetical protein Q9199_002387 [Rusavskia elegans]